MAGLWPGGGGRPDGARLDSDQDVIGTISNLLVRDTKSDVAAMTALLYDLREFERTRNLTDESRALARAYRLSQAVWASEIELRTWTLEDRAMDPELSFFLLPPPASSPAVSVSP